MQAEEGSGTGGSAPRDLDERLYRWGVAFFTALGLGVRLVYAIAWRFETKLKYDGPVYRNRSQFVLVGRSFIDPDAWFFHKTVAQGAVHPPGNPLWLAAGQLVGFDGDKGLQIWGCLLGTATIVVIALLAREVAGPRVAVIAAALAAVYPGLWSYDPTVMAETPGQFCTALALLLAYRFFRSPTPSRAAWLGAAIGLGALTRSELAVLFPVLVLPLCVASKLSFRQAAICIGSATLWLVMVIGPWVGWNALRFEHPVTLASGVDLSMAYAQCDETWYGPETGYWNVFCGSDITKKKSNALADESELGKQYRARAGRYIADHAGRWPVVIGARVGRTLSVYRPLQQIELEHNRESRETGVLYACLISYWGLVALGIVALRRPPRSRRRLLPLIAPIAGAISGAAITFGTTRYRSSAEVGLVVLAAVGIEALRTRRREAATEPAASAEAPPPTTAPAPASPV